MSDKFDPKKVVPNYSTNLSNDGGEYTITFSTEAAKQLHYPLMLEHLINEIDYFMKLHAGVIPPELESECRPIHMRICEPSEEPAVRLELRK